jgi:hypothetical protein
MRAGVQCITPSLSGGATWLAGSDIKTKGTRVELTPWQRNKKTTRETNSKKVKKKYTLKGYKQDKAKTE